MWIEPLDNGKFKYVERYYDERTGKYRKVSITLNSNSKQAQNKAQKALLKKIEAKKTKVSTEAITLERACSEWLAFKKGSVAEATYLKYRASVKVLKQYFDFKIKVDKITLIDVQKLLDDLSETHRISSIKVFKIILNQILTFAEDVYNVNINPSIKRAKIKKDDWEEKKKYIDTDQLASLVARFHKELPIVYANALEFQLLTGLRVGELIALHTTDFDAPAHTLRINKSVMLAGRKVKSPKNKYSNRIIDTSERVEEIIQEQITLNEDLFGNSGHFLFQVKNGTPLVHTTLNNQLKKIDPSLHTHMLRHTHICLLAEKGFDLKYIMNRVGHNNPKTTLKIYTHVTERLRQQQADKLNDLF